MDELIDPNKFYCVYGLSRWWTLPLSIQYNAVQIHATYNQNVHWSLQVICLKRLHFHIWGHPTHNQLYPAHQRHDLEKVNVMGKLRIDSPVWILAFIGYVYYIFILKIGGRYHEQNRPKSHQVIYRSESWILPKWIWETLRKLSRKQICASLSGSTGGGRETIAKTWNHPR